MRTLSVLSTILFLFAGCATPAIFGTRFTFARKPAESDDSLPITPRVLEQLPVDRHCRVRMLDGETAYVGRIVSVEGDRLALDEVDKVPPDDPQPRMGFPSLFSKPETPVRANAEIVDGRQSLPRERIAHVQILDFETADEYRRHRAYAVSLRDRIDQRRRLVDGGPAQSADRLASK